MLQNDCLHFFVSYRPLAGVPKQRENGGPCMLVGVALRRHLLHLSQVPLGTRAAEYRVTRIGGTVALGAPWDSQLEKGLDSSKAMLERAQGLIKSGVT